MKNTQSLFLIAFLVSFVLHLLIVMSIYHPGSIFTLTVTSGMFISWFYVSATLKDLNDEKKDFNTLHFFQSFSIISKYFLVFLTIYALINFALTFSSDPGNGWVDFNLGHDELRGISGFWLLFYFLAYTTNTLKIKLANNL